MLKNGTVDVSGQALELIPKLAFGTVVLIGDNNSLTAISDLPESIKELSLVNNKLAFLADISLQVPHLTTLDLSCNRLISIEGIGNCINLTVLKLANNYIGDDQLLSIQKLTALKYLDVSQNHLKNKNFVKILQAFEEIEEIWSCGNDFSEWVMDYSLVFLKQLVLDRNQISHIEFQKGLPALQRFSIKENLLFSIPQLKLLPNLFEIDLSHNNLQVLTLPLTSLRYLFCSHNSLSSLQATSNLEVLNISYNSLSTLQLFPRLKELNASHNNFTKFAKFSSSLFSADLSYNKLTDIQCVKYCIDLEYLNASHNLIENCERVEKELGLPRLKVLDLTGMEAENWDLVSKSKLFPSCRSSMVGTPWKNTFNSIFSDMKPVSAHTNAGRYEEPTGRFSLEFEEELSKVPVREDLSIEKPKRDHSQVITKKIKTKGKCRHKCKKHPRNFLNILSQPKPNQADSKNHKQLINNITEYSLEELEKPLTTIETYEIPAKKYAINLNHILVYAKTPPKPVLPSEKHKTFIVHLHSDSYEFALVTELLQQEGCRVLDVEKIYNYLMHQQLVETKELHKNNKNQNQNYLLFHFASEKNLMRICKDPTGFSAVYQKHESVFFSTSVRIEMDFDKKQMVLLVLINSKWVERIEEDVYKSIELEKAVPVYLINFT